MKKPFGGIVLDTAFRIIVPFTLIYGVYVLIFGEAGPGGGFQAGALLSLNGGNFLDYSYLPFKAEHTNELHALGILFIEIGVTICVMMTIINILDAVVERGDENGSAK